MVRNHYYTHSVLRLLTALKMSYEAAKKRAEPYTKYQDCGGTPRDATGDGGTGQKGSDLEPASLCVGEQSFGGECASDHIAFVDRELVELCCEAGGRAGCDSNEEY
jgi:hypothetical protein